MLHLRVPCSTYDKSELYLSMVALRTTSKLPRNAPRQTMQLFLLQEKLELQLIMSR